MTGSVGKRLAGLSGDQEFSAGQSEGKDASNIGAGLYQVALSVIVQGLAEEMMGRNGLSLQHRDPLNCASKQLYYFDPLDCFKTAAH